MPYYTTVLGRLEYRSVDVESTDDPNGERDDGRDQEAGVRGARHQS